MRYSPQHKEQTRARIVRAAARRFRTGGAPGAGIASLMRDLKLTHGGFYRHFDSKEQLFEEALQAGVTDMGAHISAIAERAGRDGAFAAIVAAYLSEGHCDNPAEGCPLAAMAAEIARLPRRSRDTCSRMLMAYAGRMAPYMPGPTPEAREHRAVVLFSSMAGTVALARAVSDPGERAVVLRAARDYHFSAAGV